MDDDGTAGGEDLAREFPSIEVLRTERPVFWTGAIVLGIERALQRGDPSVLFLNQDVTVSEGYFGRLAATAPLFPEALVGSAVLYAGDPARVWSAGGRIEWWGRGPRALYHGVPADRLPSGPYEADWLFGMGTFVPSPVFGRIGLPDGERFPMAWGDLDFSLRAKRAGIRILVDPGLRLFHEVGRYDARAAGPPSARLYVSWMGDPRHNLSLACHEEIWRRHGPRLLWPLSLALRVLTLLVNYVRIRLLFPGEGRDE